MTLQWKIDEEAHGKLDENLQGLYKQKDGNFVLDCEGAEGKDDIKGLKAALETEREAARKFQRQLKQAQEATKGLSREDLDKMVATQNENAQTIKQLQQERDEALAKILDGQIGTAVAEANGNLALLRPAIREELKRNPEADVGELVASMKQDENFQSAFKASSHSGGGSHSDDSGRASSSVGGGGPSWKGKRRSQMTDREAVDAQKELGLDAYMDLPA